MKKDFLKENWKDYLPQPVCEEFPEYAAFYDKAWEIARAHVKEIPGMPQSPYMDEAFCDTQIWIWDTCFMSLFCKFAQEVFPGVESFQNFYDVLYSGKRLPFVIPSAKEPAWTKAVPGKPFQVQVHIADNPPLFAWSEYENALIHGDKEYLKTLLYEKKILQKHYAWIEGLQENEDLPNVANPTMLKCEKYGYKWEAGRSGMDNTPRGRTEVRAEMDRPNNPDMLWIDVICQQALSAKVLAKMFEMLEDRAQAKEWEEKYAEKKDIVNAYYWDKEDGFYYDIDCNSHRFYKVPTIASYWTLTAGIASEEQALSLVKYMQDENAFGGEVPLVSLSRSDADFSEQGKYWRGGLWLPTAYAALKGVSEYGFHEEAHVAAHKIFRHMLATYQEYEPHTIWECYSPTENMPATSVRNIRAVRPDFCGWSALGPISILIEYVLGFHGINAFEEVVEWNKPEGFKGEVGIKNLRFGEIVTDIVANGNICNVNSNKPYRLMINGKEFAVERGENTFVLE